MIIVGHRGARALEPENTLPALRKGMRCADYVEVDVRMSSDEKPVIIHDKALERTTNGTGHVKDHTFEELRRLDAGKGERIPALEEVLELVRDGPGLFIEIKEPGTEEAISDCVRQCRPVNLYFVSFHEQSLASIREFDPDARTGLIYSKESPRILETAERLRVDVILPALRLADEMLVNDAHARGMLVIPWILNSRSDFEKAVAIGADGLASDDPCAAREYFSGKK